MTRKLPRVAKLSLVVAAALSAVVVAGGSAFASHNDSFTVKITKGTCSTTGDASFVDYGRSAATVNDDYASVGDWCKDGYGVKAWAYLNGKSLGSKYNGSGAGTAISWDPFGNVTGGQRIGLKVCLVKGKDGTPVNCVSKTVESVDG